MDNKIVAFCCENSALQAAAAVTDPAVLEAVDIVPLPCTGKVEIGLVLKCLEQGKAGVLVLGCPVDNCKYLIGSTRARKRILATKKLLKEAGVNEERVHMDFVSSVDAPKFERIVRAMQARLAATPSEAAAAAPATAAKGGAK